MRTPIEVPTHILSHLNHLVAEREEMRKTISRRVITDERGNERSEYFRHPPLSRSAMVSRIIELGFDLFVIEYPTSEALLRLPAPTMGRPRGK